MRSLIFCAVIIPELTTSHVSNISDYFNNSSATADELFQCVRPFCGVGAERVKNLRNFATKDFHDFKCKIENGTKYVILCVSSWRYWQWDRSKTWNDRYSCKYIVTT